MDDDLELFQLPKSPEQSEQLLHQAKPRLKVAERNQIEFKVGSIDDLIPADHLVRLVWDYVNQLNMSSILGTIQSVEGNVGRPATDPKILLSLWLYATLEGIVSARVLADYCEEHLAYKWICGDVKTNHHTLSDFAAKYGRQFDEFLTESVAILMKKGFVDLEEVSLDGMRVRASAGASSFRRAPKLLECHEKAKQYLKKLRQELTTNPSTNRSKKEAAAMRAAEEREKRVKDALEELKKLKEEKEKSNTRGKKALSKILENARSSTTDPEARVMKMACGGFRPAYNVQFATTKKGRAIVGVDVTDRGNDAGLIKPMIKRIKEKFGRNPVRCLVDGGYSDYSDVTETTQQYGCHIYMPPKTSGRADKNPYKVLPKDTAEIAEWRGRMSTDEGKEIYKGRGSTAEFSNAQSRNKGMQQFFVRGLERVKSIVCIFAITHNMQRLFGMNFKRA